MAIDKRWERTGARPSVPCCALELVRRGSVATVQCPPRNAMALSRLETRAVRLQDIRGNSTVAER